MVDAYGRRGHKNFEIRLVKKKTAEAAKRQSGSFRRKLTALEE